MIVLCILLSDLILCSPVHLSLSTYCVSACCLLSKF